MEEHVQAKMDLVYLALKKALYLRAQIYSFGALD